MELLNHLPEIFPYPFYIKDSLGKFILTNDAFAQLYHTTATNLLSQGTLPFDYAAERDQEILAAGLLATFEECYKQSNGDKIWFSTVKKPFKLPDGKNYLLSVSSDISQYKTHGHIENSNSQIPDATIPNQQKDLIQTASSIQNLAQQLADDLTNAEQKNQLEELIKLAESLFFKAGEAIQPESKPPRIVQAPDLPQEPASAASPRIPQDKKIRVLLADDNEINLALTTAQLEAKGIEVQPAVNGAEALQMAREKEFELILMDIQMPQLDGMAATKYIRQEENPNQNTPIIAFTANIYNLGVAEYKQNGFSDLLPKPYVEADLMNIISRYTAFKLTAILTEPKLYDFSGLGDLGRDAAFIRKMQSLFIQTVPQQLDELSEALAQENWAAVTAVAHKLKSTYGNIRINGPAAAMKKIELLALEKKDLNLIPNLLLQAQETSIKVIEVFSREL